MDRPSPRSASRGAAAAHDPSELSLTERTLSIVLGLTLAAAAARPRPNRLLSVAALAAGSWLAWRGATGRCAIKGALEEEL